MFSWLSTWKASKLKNAYRKLARENHFNLIGLDSEIGTLADTIYQKHNKKFLSAKTRSGSIGIFATILYDQGGHTECVRSLIDSLHTNYQCRLFLSCKARSEKKSPRKSSIIYKQAKVAGVNFNGFSFTRNLIKLYNQIVSENPKIIFVFIHPNDVLSTAVLSLLKTHTDIKLVYYNHASHFPALGFAYADLVLEGMPCTHYVTKHYRQVDKSHVFGLQSRKEGETKYITPTEIADRRKALGIPPNTLVTMTGCSSAKLFDGHKSEYFEMIKRLLSQEPKLYHVVITQLKQEQQAIVDEIFLNEPEARSRLIFTNFVADFDPLFQSCDVFIDSFPVSSALTQIDLMRNKKPTVVKINETNALLSFHEYMPSSYPYMFADVSDMEKAILRLLHNPKAQSQITQDLYQYYLGHFEGDCVKNKYIAIIQNADNLDKFYDILDKDLHYNMPNIM